MFKFLIALSLAVTTSKAFSRTEAEINAEALEKTQALLRDPNQRAKAASEDSKAAATMKSTDKFVGPNNTQETYDLSADIFGSLEKKANGNPAAAIEAAQKNPEEFFNSLSPEQQARIHELSQKIESERGPTSEVGHH